MDKNLRRRREEKKKPRRIKNGKRGSTANAYRGYHKIGYNSFFYCFYI